MDVGDVVAFWAVSALFVITPGADWAYAITAGLQHRSALPAVAGLLVGHLTATAAVAAGVAALVAGSPAALQALTIAGAAYLLWLGAGMLLHPQLAPIAGDGGPTTVPGWRQVLKGAGISGLNPKVILLFLALLPQFTAVASSWPIIAQIIVLGLIHTATCAVVYTVVGTAARTVLRTRPTTAQAVARISGTAMILVATALLVEQLLH